MKKANATNEENIVVENITAENMVKEEKSAPKAKMPKKKKGKAKWIVLGIVGVIVIGLGVLIASALSAVPVVGVTKASIGDVESYLSVTGMVSSGEQTTYFVPASAKVVAVNFSVGDIVKKGDPIIVFDQADLDSALKQASLNLRNAQLQAADLQNTINTDKQDLADVLEEIRVLENRIDMHQNDHEYDAKTAQWEATLEGKYAKRDQLEKTSVTPQQIEQANIGVSLASLTYQDTLKMVNDGKGGIIAGYDGVLTTINLVEGGTAQPGQVAAVLESLDDVKVKFTVGKYDVARLKLGQPAIVTFGDTKLQGEVTHIAAAAQTTAEGTVLAAEVTVDDPNHILKLGLETDIEILTAKEASVLVVPVEAVKVDKDGNYVYTVELMPNTKDMYQPVKTYVNVGASSDTEIIITEGLSEGAMVIRMPPKTIDSMRVVRILEGDVFSGAAFQNGGGMFATTAG